MVEDTFIRMSLRQQKLPLIEADMPFINDILQRL